MIDERNQIRGFIQSVLVRKGDPAPFADGDRLFSRGRLDSMSVLELIMFIETQFSVDTGSPDFDITLLDSVDDIMRLIDL
jgi:acyl carrier protein